MKHSTACSILVFLTTAVCLSTSFSQTAGKQAGRALTLETGVVLTTPVQRRLAALIATQFAKEAPSKGFESKDIDIIATAMDRGSLKRAKGGGSHGFVAEDSAGQTTRISRPDQVDYVSHLFSANFASLFLAQFATVHLDVTPAPPRDYNIIINSEDCRPTEKGLYVVLPGATAVRVTRAGKPPCAWEGNITEGKEQLVSCNL
jgi:hypothetical protein